MTTARVWLLWVSVGFTVAILGPAAGMPAAAALGGLLVLVGLFGLAWRLLANR